MRLTNLEVTSFEEACEKVRWYGLRWRIEMFFKVIKSGFRVKACRLAHGERLARYLTIMSIVAWPLFMITLIARTDPNQCCSSLLTRREWEILFRRTHRNNKIPQNPPTIKEAVAWITRLEGHRGRKSDGPPWDDHPLERMEATYGFMRGRKNQGSDNLYLWVIVSPHHRPYGFACG